MKELSYELNLDGLVGPTHSYAGLSYGNVASFDNRRAVSNPKEAALQGLRKMKALADLGLKQAVLPPQERPDLDALRRIGFAGSDAELLKAAAAREPALLAAAASASAMWAANAATVSPSADTRDGRVHFTPANLVSQFHRGLEAATTGRVLKKIFDDEARFAHHEPLPYTDMLADEGAANHTRLCGDYGEAGLEVFVYGRRTLSRAGERPNRFPARQTLEASQAVARLHGLDERAVLMLRQNPNAIDAGAFHNDVVAVGNLDVFLYHTAAFAEHEAAANEIRRAYGKVTSREVTLLEVKENELPLSEALSSYLFNSQIVRLPDSTVALIAPLECQENRHTRNLLDRFTATGGPIHAVHFVDVRQSMRNGGGPACLRLRVAVTETELGRVHPGVMLTPALYTRLTDWVQRHYRETLSATDLADPRLLAESCTALDELTQILLLGSIYPFQRVTR